MRSARMDLACASLVMFFSSNAGSKSGSAAMGLAASSPLMVPLWTTGRASSLWRWRPGLVSPLPGSSLRSHQQTTQMTYQSEPFT